MITTKLFSFVFLLCSFFAFGQIVNIPDANFKKKLLEASPSYYIAKDLNGNYFKIDANGNGEIEVSEAESVGQLNVSGYYISSLEGISSFKNLQTLRCPNNLLTSLNVQGLTKLQTLDCPYSQLTSLNVQGCTNLQTLRCPNNLLTSLNVQGCTNLQTLTCFDSQLPALNVQGCTNLLYLNCSNNQLPSLNVQGCTNLQTLNCSNNQLPSLNVQGLTKLQTLNCYVNQLTSLNVQGLTNLQTLDCYSNQLTSLNVQGCTNLKTLNCYTNQLTSLNVQDCTNLRTLSCYKNQLTSLNVQGCTNLQTLNCRTNQLLSLNVQGLINLQTLNCYVNQLMSLNVQGLTNLRFLRCYNNDLTSLNVQGLINLEILDCHTNQLISLNLKTGGNKTWNTLSFNDNKNLKYICCNEKDIIAVLQQVKNNGQTAEVNTYCSFEPTGEKNIIIGKLTSCDAQNIVFKNTKVKINDGINTGYIFSNEIGNYETYGGIGSYTLTPIFENPYFTISPATVNFTTLNNTKTQDLCITPIPNKNDLTVSIVPVDRARPGFKANYQIIYKNKGTTTLTGNVIFRYNDDFTDLVSSSVPATTTEKGKLSFDFTDLKPFEEKIINVELRLNTPTHLSFPLDGDEILSFNAQILPIQNDAAPRDNVFALRQDVVNSFDPNDKTCLQGNSITPEMIGEFVDYQIRFENNGSAEATFIVVKDIIDTNLFDIETLTPTSSSHPYHLTIKNGNVVEFYFEDINLPFAPKEANDPRAQGFVSFKIKTKSTLKLGDVLKNKADIYFDYNKPILTNEELTKIENLSNEEIITNSKFKINFTNPAKDKITFSEEVKSVSVFDLSGKLVQSSIIKGKELNVSNLKSGNYVIKISTENGNATEKLVKE
jgi:uncharacterized repeat protein (TIGR01451 family)